MGVRMTTAESKLEAYSDAEVIDGLRLLRAKYPSVFKWFFIWEMEKLHGARGSDPRLDQEQEADSRQA